MNALQPEPNLFGRLIIGLILLFIAAALLRPFEPNAVSPSASPDSTGGATAAIPAEPPQQLAFEKALSAGMKKISAAERQNDHVAAGQERKTLQQTLCQIVSNPADRSALIQINGWVGKVSRRGTDETADSKEAFAYLAVETPGRLRLETRDAPVLAREHVTTIDRASPMYEVVSTLQIGAPVRFSGSLFRDRYGDIKGEGTNHAQSCLELSLSVRQWLNSSYDSPDDPLLFRFSTLEKIAQ